AVEEGIIEKAGSWFTYKNEKLGQGREQAKNFLKNNLQLVQEIETAIRKKFVQQQTSEDTEQTQLKVKK
ncbi:MAG: DNA recombination/repair protein RecA, partial [Endomicrobia bacterium]|nr:DNA recombination/repair protein RecA [Endomicrobiia bacterium]